jgi:hypothetical protein
MVLAEPALTRERQKAQKKPDSPGFVGPPWAPQQRNNPTFSKRTPMDEFLERLGSKSDSMNDFAAATFAMVNKSNSR